MAVTEDEPCERGEGQQREEDLKSFFPRRETSLARSGVLESRKWPPVKAMPAQLGEMKLEAVMSAFSMMTRGRLRGGEQGVKRVGRAGGFFEREDSIMPHLFQALRVIRLSLSPDGTLFFQTRLARRAVYFEVFPRD